MDVKMTGLGMLSLVGAFLFGVMIAWRRRTLKKEDDVKEVLQVLVPCLIAYIVLETLRPKHLDLSSDITQAYLFFAHYCLLVVSVMLGILLVKGANVLIGTESVVVPPVQEPPPVTYDPPPPPRVLTAEEKLAEILDKNKK